ncbi:hypothetical protein CASFOL_027872 [Castilleja foliolosa]|uniref:Dof zinc finger protein n=1 Tax=Castilleja foliolosa TaxID=1961234 RepID=A0ABD3CIP7_9LAMI
MGISSLQVCIDSSDWVQLWEFLLSNAGNVRLSNPTVGFLTEVGCDLITRLHHGPISDENNTTVLTNSSSQMTTPTSNCDDILTCSRPITERRLIRPEHQQALKCPRCESTHTKFCYYNNYSLTQPRYFCKSCRRYWTKGGTLRNIPVGGGCRKNKKPSSNPKKLSSSSTTNTGPDQINPLSSPDLILDVHAQNRAWPTDFHARKRAGLDDLRLAFPEQLQFSSIHGPGLFTPLNTGYLFENMGPSPVEYVGTTNKYEHTAFMGMQNPSHDFHNPLFGLEYNYEHGIDNGASNILNDEKNHHLINNNNHHDYYHHDEVDVKLNSKILSLEWHDCNSGAGIKDSFGYGLGGIGSWTGLMNGYGPSATNPLV